MATNQSSINPGASAGPSPAELERLISNSFLNRVPDFLDGHTMAEAIQLAYDHEEEFLLRLQIGQADWAKEARRRLCENVYNRLREDEP